MQNEVEITRNENSTKTILIKQNRDAYRLAAVTSIKISIANEAQTGLLVTSRACSIDDSDIGEISFETLKADFATITFEVNPGAREIDPKYFLAQLELLYSGETDPEIITFTVKLKPDIPVVSS